MYDPTFVPKAVLASRSKFISVRFHSVSCLIDRRGIFMCCCPLHYLDIRSFYGWVLTTKSAPIGALVQSKEYSVVLKLFHGSVLLVQERIHTRTNSHP